jgi:hypothetical protein
VSLGEAAVGDGHPTGEEPVAGDVQRISQPLGERSDVVVGPGAPGVVMLVEVSRGDELVGGHEHPVVTRRPGEFGRALEFRSRRPRVRMLHGATPLAARPGRGGAVTHFLSERERLRRVRVGGLGLACVDGNVSAAQQHTRTQRGLPVPTRVQRTSHSHFRFGETTPDVPPPLQGRAETQREPRVAPQRALDRRCEVGSLRVKDLKPLALPACLELRTSSLRESQERVTVASAQRVALAGVI